MLLYIGNRLEESVGHRLEAYKLLLDNVRDLRAAEQPILEQRLLRFDDKGLAGKFVSYVSQNPNDLWTMGEF